jgi:hypothetical protein
MTSKQPATERRHWVFLNPCGCPDGIIDVDRDTDTRSKAWREFYDRADNRNAALGRGVTCEEISHSEYVRNVEPKMLTSCPHVGVTA